MGNQRTAVRGRIDRGGAGMKKPARCACWITRFREGKIPLEAHTARRTDTTPDYAAVDVVLKGKAKWLGRSAVAAVFWAGNGSR